MPGLLLTRVPLLVTDAELDPDMFRDETAKLTAAPDVGETDSPSRSAGSFDTRALMRTGIDANRPFKVPIRCKRRVT